MTPWTVAHQAPLSMGFPRQEYWSGLPIPSPGDLPDSGIKPASSALADRFFTSGPPGKPKVALGFIYLFIFLGNTVYERLYPVYDINHVRIDIMTRIKLGEKNLSFVKICIPIAISEVSIFLQCFKTLF